MKLPKRPISCLAALAIPLGIILILVVLAGYAIKFFSPSSLEGAAEIVAQKMEVTVTRRLPDEIATTTQIAVATISEKIAAREQVYRVDEFGKTTNEPLPENWRVDFWKTHGFVLNPPDEDIANSYWQLTGAGWDVPLRTPGGSKWLDPVIWGVFSNGRVAIVSHRDRRALLSVSRSGQVTVIEVLDDDLSPLIVHGSSAWFVRGNTEGQGIEQLPKGPSSLVRITSQGTSSTVAQDPEAILRLLPSPDEESLAYVTSDGTLVLAKGDKLSSTIKGWVPQAWLDNRYLLISRQKTLAWIDTTNPDKPYLLSDFADPIRTVQVSTSSTSIW